MTGYEDPYAGLLETMTERGRRAQRPGWCLGTVAEIGEGRLVIRADGHELDQEDLMVNPLLLYDAQEDLKVTYSAGGGEVELGVYGSVPVEAACGAGHHSSIEFYGIPGTREGTVKVTVTSQRLKAGDRVVLLPDSEGQIYYVVCKVVSVA